MGKRRAAGRRAAAGGGNRRAKGRPGRKPAFDARQRSVIDRRILALAEPRRDGRTVLTARQKALVRKLAEAAVARALKRMVRKAVR